jgi:tRNA threonylcarbamoyladenosine biosynthesis protein TsaB
MNILALDTSTEACSAALWQDGAVLWRQQLAPRQHAQLILQMLDELLAEADQSLGMMDAIAFGRGPGAFTGVRIAAAVTQGMAYSVDLPVVPVSSLAALAHGAWRETQHGHILTAMDARIHEVYWAAYHVSQEGQADLAVEEAVQAAAAVTLPDGHDWYGVGSGFAAYEDALLAACDDKLVGHAAQYFPLARDVAALAAAQVRLGNVVPAEQALPVYLRDKVAEKKKPA